MSQDGIADETSRSSVVSPQKEDRNADYAARRLAQEARQAVTFGMRSVKDVTNDFAMASKQLRQGQLVKDEYFSLFEAVSALEIMDGKMDSGYVPPGDSFLPDFDPCQGLAAAELLWIVDQLLTLEMAWLDGYPLAQTVYTSLHVDRLLSSDNRPPYTFGYGDDTFPNESQESQLVHVVLRAYCIALVKCCENALMLVQSQNFYEEEDFVTHLFGRELLPKTPVGNAMHLLDEAVRWLDKTSSSDRLIRALGTHLRFRKAFLSCLTEGNDWNAVLELIKEVEESHHLGSALPEAFSDKVQRQLAASTPPRPLLRLSWADAITKWRSMSSDILEAYRLTDFWVLQSPQCLQRATWAFAYRDPPPNTLARANFQDIIFGTDRISEDISHFDLFLTDLRDLVLAGDKLGDAESFQIELPSDPRHQCSRLIEAFMDKAFDEYLNLYRMVCQNRCRIRRTFTQAIPIFDQLVVEALKSDSQLHEVCPQPTIIGKDGERVRLNPLTSWTRYYQLMLVTWTVQLGFETDIYLADELCGMYWLLSVMAQSRCMLLQHINAFLTERTRKATNEYDARHLSECLASADWIRSLTAIAEVTRMLSLALWRLYSLLMALGIIRSPRRDFATNQLLYEARMKPFLQVRVHDAIPSAEDFALAQQHVHSVEATCSLMELDIKGAKAQLAELKKMTPQQAKYVGTEEMWRREVKQLETTCVAIAVQGSQLLRVYEKRGEKTGGRGGIIGPFVGVSVPPPGKRYHDYWVVPQVSPLKMGER